MAEDAPKRVRLKLRGEALMGDLPYGIDSAMLDTIAGQLKTVQEMHIQVAIVVGGGNIFRGAEASAVGMDRATADYAGMLATIINALALHAAIEIGADFLLMAKNNVNGVFEADPLKDPSARKFRTLNYLDALNRRLQVMDSTALSLCMENSLPIIVFDVRMPRSIELAASGKDAGTTVGDLET